MSRLALYIILGALRPRTSAACKVQIILPQTVGNTDVWNKMKNVIGSDKTKTQMTVDDGQTYADELNDFYGRFDVDSTPDDNSQFKIDHLTCFSDDDVPTFDTESTRKVF